MRDGAWAIPDFGFDHVAGIDDVFHPFFDHGQIIGGKRFSPVEIVIPAVFDHRADRHFDIGPQLLHGARHDMGQIMADQL